MFTILGMIFGFWLIGCVICAVVHVAWWTIRLAFKILVWVILAGVVMGLLAIPAVAALAIAAGVAGAVACTNS